MSNEMKNLTGRIDTDLIILSKLLNDKLNLMCHSNKYISSLCQKDKLYTCKIINEFNMYRYNFLDFKILYGFKSFKEYYINVYTTINNDSFLDIVNTHRLDLVILKYYI